MLDQIRQPKIDQHSRGSNNRDKFPPVTVNRVTAGISDAYVAEWDGYEYHRILEVNGRCDQPKMLIDAKGNARLVRKRKSSAIDSYNKYVYLNSKVYHLSDTPFEEPASKIFALYELALSEVK